MSSPSFPRLAVSRLFALLVGLVLAGPAVSSAVAAPTPMVDLGQASTYAALSGASVGNTVSAVGAPHTTLRGDLGVKANAQPTGFPPGVVTGTTRVGTPAAAQAHADAGTAYAEIAARTGGAALAGELAGATIPPGLHTIAAAGSNTGTVTFDAGGNPDAVFVMQVNGALAMAAGSHVVLTNGARASRVFWQVNGAGSIGASADFAGTLIALDAVAVGNGSLVNGRAIARTGALTLDNNQFYSAPPVVTIDGGATATTTDTTPTISGTTDVEAPRIVTVTVAGQTLTATPSGGGWSVTSSVLANATYPVVASVRDAAQNPGSATQQLTVDTVLPVISIDGGPAVTTNDPTPTISGSSDVAAGTTVRVAVDGQLLTALVQAGGGWNVTPATLTDGSRVISASVTDPAGNQGTDSQELTIDTTAPAVTIAGGHDALTNDPTPELSGTADVVAGTTVTVSLADQTLTTDVQNDGTWSVTSATLSDGPHRVTVSVADTAANASSTVQTLTVDTVAPTVAIAGGAADTTEDGDPTIAGVSDAAPGTVVTVGIAGQTRTTLLQPDGTWNATPNFVGPGTWTVDVSVPDPAGNVGRAQQTLTITGGAPAVTPTPTPTSTPTTTPTSTPTTTPTSTPTTTPTSTPTTTPTPTSTTTPTPTSTTTPMPTSTGTPTPTTTSPPAPTAAPTSTPTATPTPPVNAAVKAVVARHPRRKMKGSTLTVATRVTAPARGRVVATATGAVKIAGVKRAIRLTKATARIAARHSATLRLEPKGGKRAIRTASRRIRSAVARGRKVTAAINVKITDAAGHTRVVKQKVTLTR